MFPSICCMCAYTDEQLALIARLVKLFIPMEDDHDRRDHLWHILSECRQQQAIREMRQRDQARNQL